MNIKILSDSTCDLSKELLEKNNISLVPLTVIKNDGTAETIQMPFDHTGFEYQVRECGRCIAAGLTASPVYPPQTSIAHMQALENIRADWGMKFSGE